MAADPYMTPGSAVADQLQNILARKALEARQSQSDALNAQNVQSQIAARASQAEETKARIAGLNADRAARELKDRASLYGPDQPMQPGADLDYFEKVAPNLINPGQPAQPQWEYEGQPDLPATGKTFRGLPGEVDKKRVADQKDAALRVITDPAQYAKLSPAQRVITAHQAGITIPEAIANPDKGQETWLDPDQMYNGQVTDSHTHPIPRPPKEPAQPRVTVHNSGPQMEDDPDHPGQTRPTGKWFQEMSDGSIRYTDSPGHVGVVHDPRPRVGASGPYTDPKALTSYQAVLKAENPKNVNLPAHIDLRSSTRERLIANIADKAVQDDVRKIMDNPTAKILPVEKLRPAITGTPEHIQAVIDRLHDLGKR